MKKFSDPVFRETWYEETMPGGLKAVVIHKPMFVTTSCLFATPYGSLDCCQTDEQGRVYSFPKGTAHFLEHKLFESDHGDVMDDFSRMGASVNAYTSYEETVYYFNSSAGDISEPLRLLLDFVQDFSVSEQSVEREKGIILEERNMYNQDPDSRIMLEVMKNMYAVHPVNEDIVGSPESIRSFSRKILEEAYRLNYHPSRMMLVCVTPCDPAAIMDIIRTSQQCRHFAEAPVLKRAVYAEPAAVVKDKTVLHMDVSCGRSAIGFKLAVRDESAYERALRECCIKLCLDAWFTAVNPDYQNWIDEGYITPYFSYDLEIEEDRANILFLDEKEDGEAFRSFIISQMEKCISSGIREQTLDQLRKRALGSILHLLNSPSDLSAAWFHGISDGISVFDEFRMISRVSAETCLKMIRSIHTDASTLVILRKTGKNAE